MIKIENVVTPSDEQMKAIIRGMRNPMNSWDNSDSGYEEIDENEWLFNIGEKDKDLMKRLAEGGPVHAKYRRFINVYVDVDAPLYFWKEFKTYRKGKDFIDKEDFYSYEGDHLIEDSIEMNSCSTMHKIHSKEFTLNDFSTEHQCEDVRDVMATIIKTLNKYRTLFLETQDKKYWWQMIQLLPSSYNQRRTVMLNYEVLGAIYHWRKNHKLDEWVEFCKWIETLPLSELITEKRTKC